MKIMTEHLDRLFQKYGEGFQLKYFNDIVIRGNCFLSNDIVMKDHILQLRQNGIHTVDVFFDREFYDTLSHEFPTKFRKPYGRLSFFEMDRLLEILNAANAQTKRKRYIHIVGDFYGIHPSEGKRIILLEHNEIIDYKKWNSLKKNMDKDYQFFYRNSELPIIIFVDLSRSSESSYVERFKKNMDLISLLVSKIDDYENIIAPDFIPVEDVISVTEPLRLLEEYIKNNARLIIIGEQLNESYKQALINVRKYDKFVRMLVVPSLDYSNLNHFFKQVNLVYNVDRWIE